MESGIVYPEITIAGTTYTVRVTRGVLAYRFGKAGVDLANIWTRFSAQVDALHAMILEQFQGTAEQLAELIEVENKRVELARVVFEAMRKVFPPTQPAVAAGDGAPVQAVQ